MNCMKSFRKSILIALVILTLLSITSCVTFDYPEGQYPTEGPIFLSPAAQDLRGVGREDIVVETKDTIKNMTLNTMLIREVAQKSGKAVVSIYVRTQTPVRVSLLPIPIFGQGIPVELPGSGLGSGFFIHPSGYILSNNHVIKDAEHIRVITQAGDDFGVIIVARDPVFDLALLKIQDTEQEFPVLPMGDSEVVRAGDIVIAVGNPLGLGHTVTWGIISQTGRNLTGVSVSDEEARQIQFIQTDAAINPGSSGGPLITLTGAWIGVNTAGITQAQGIGFAVPSNQVKEFLDNIREGRGQLETESY